MLKFQDRLKSTKKSNHTLCEALFRRPSQCSAFSKGACLPKVTRITWPRKAFIVSIRGRGFNSLVDNMLTDWTGLLAQTRSFIVLILI